MNYGMLTGEDFLTMDMTLEILCSKFGRGPLKVLEIGVHNGGTSRGMKAFIESKGRTIEYWGIDRDTQTKPPFEGATLVIGDSLSVCEEIPAGLHLIFIDGCHCLFHAKNDFLLFGELLQQGGLVAFHDTTPNAVYQDYQGHGHPEDPHSYISVRKAIKDLGLFEGRRPDWELVLDRPGTEKIGGITVFQKLGATGGHSADL
jgi:hypothetical protein